MTLKCTKDLKELLEKYGYDFKTPNNEEQNAWHARLIKFGRLKYLLCTHDKTLFAFVIPNITKQYLLKFNEHFSHYLMLALGGCNLLNENAERLLSDCQNITFAKSDNKSVLASMNQQVYQIEAIVYHDRIELQDEIDLINLDIKLNKIFMTYKGEKDYAHPKDKMQEYLDGFNIS